MSNLNERITLLRTIKSMSQKEFSEIVGIPRSSISEIESGKRSPNVDLIIGISTHFDDINTDWLLTGNGNMYRDAAFELDPQTEKVVKIMKQMDTAQKTTIEAAAENIERFNVIQRQLSELTARLTA